MDSAINPLTGLYFSNAFFERAEMFLKQADADVYCMVAIDLEHFRLFNKLYSREEGDSLLRSIADRLKVFQEEVNGIAGYMGGDNYGVLMPYKTAYVEKLRTEVTEEVAKWNNTVGYLPAFGICPIDDITVPAGTLYDRATIALAHVIGNYLNRCCEYKPDMEEKVEEELRVLSEVQVALEKDEFTFFIQPQCNITTGKIVGGESLVRWRHSTKGLIPPGVFIPVLEKNGFIADLDKIVWRKVCAWLRSWIDKGYQPVPVSINVSIIDIFSMDVPAYLKELLHTYNLPAKLLKVEITESAYAENNDKVIRTVKQLRDEDFLVMMDDFGSGYSSLNMLKSVAVDVLKLDMRFLDMDDEEEEKGVGILESVVNMARQMHMPIVVEGVENQKQESFLMKMGCRYSQGYYYYKPMPVEEFEKLIADERNIDLDGIWCKQTESLHLREFLDSNLFTDTMVNNILGPAAFYDMYENNIEITRVNEPYYHLAGIPLTEKEGINNRFWNHVRADDRQVLFSIFAQAYENPSGGAQGYIHYMRADGNVLWVYLRVFFLRERQGHKIFYASLTDMTAVKNQKQDEGMHDSGVAEIGENQLRHMEKYYGNMPCGYAVGRLVLDDAGNPVDYEVVYANHEMSRISGGDMDRLRYLMLKLFSDNVNEILAKAYRAGYLGETVEHYAYSAHSCRYLQLTMSQHVYGYVSCMVQDVTQSHLYENTMKNILLSYREVYFVHLQDNYCRMIYPDDHHLMERGNYEAVVSRHFGTGRILLHDEKNVRRFLSLANLRNALKEQDTIEYKYRRSIQGIGEEWCLTSFNVCERENGEPKTAILTIRSIEALMREKEEKKHQMMGETLANMSDGFFVYSATDDEKVLFANPSVLKLYGCRNMKEFRALVDNSFAGMVHPEDLNRVQWQIHDQVKHSDKKMDFIRYRIIRKDGEIRWIDDCGHLEDAESEADSKLFYVFISDVTETLTEQEKERLIQLSQSYNERL